MGRRGNGEGSIRKRKDGRWEGRYTVQTADGAKQKTVYGKTRKEVSEKLVAAMASRNRGIVVDDKNLKVGEYLDNWLKDAVRGTVKESTFSRDEYLVNNHIKPALGRIKLKNLNAMRLQGLYRDLLDSGLSGSTVQKVHHALSQAVKWDLIHRNPADAAKAPAPSTKEKHPLSAPEARRLLEAARGDRLEALYVLAVHTGMRRGELLGLKWEDVDLDAATLRVRRALTRTENGRKLALGEPKTKKSRRTVRLTPRAVETLKGHRAQQAAERLRPAASTGTRASSSPGSAGASSTPRTSVSGPSRLSWSAPAWRTERSPSTILGTRARRSSSRGTSTLSSSRSS